jgi:hypothetical protein
VFGRGGALESSWYGDCLPSRDFPMLMDQYRQGRLPPEAFVSETIGLGDVEQVLRHDAPYGRAALGGRAVTAAIRHGVTTGAFSLDGGTLEIDNNVWMIAVLCSHAHDDPVTVAKALSQPRSRCG